MLFQDFDASSFVKGFDRNLENAHEVRMAVRQAKKYILDYQASRQLIDIALPSHWEKDMGGLRRMARSPYSKIWIEFNNKARRERLLEVYDEEVKRLDKNSPGYKQACANLYGIAGADEVIPRLAWLVETHPEQPSDHRASLVMAITFDGKVRPFFSDEDQKKVRPIQVMPFAFRWDTEDSPSSKWGHTVMFSMNSEESERGDFSNIKQRLDIAEISTGIVGNKDEFVGLTKGYGVPTKAGKFYKELCTEFSGELRYIMAFIASLNVSKIVETTNFRGQSGKHASGKTYPDYEFSEVRITLPRKRRLAPYIAQHGLTGIRKREHDVERFWRTYEHGSGPFCEADHVWELGAVPDKQYCACCPAWRTWVKEHKRGDRTLGRIEHVRRVVT